MELKLNISPCPNDTFMFDAMLNGRIDTEGLTFSAEYRDIEELNRALRDADKLLAEPDPAVTDKGMTPPSGDKHDYISMGRYWWPNPDTEDGLPYVRRDGHSNPDLKKFDRDRWGASRRTCAG